MSQETNCPSCGYGMKVLYNRTKNSSGKRVYKSVDILFCERCLVALPSNEIKIPC